MTVLANRRKAFRGPNFANYNMFGFDGVGDYVSTSYNLDANSDYTASVWVKTGATLLDDNDRVLSATNSSTVRNLDLLLRLSDGIRVGVTSSGGSAFTAGSLFLPTINTLYHLVATVDASAKTIRLYVNASDIGNAVWTGTIAATSPLIVGGRALPPIGDLFIGSISEPAIFNRVLSPAEITTLCNSGTPKLFSAYPTSITDDSDIWIEMTSNDNSLNDLSGNGNNGTANGGVTSDGAIIQFEI